MASPDYSYECDFLQPPHCEVCDSRSGLVRCSGCNVAYYCGRDHQNLDEKDHKQACKTVEKAHTTFSKEEATLRNNPDNDSMISPRLFEEQVGLFWLCVETRGYMRARYRFVDALLVNFPDHQVAVQTALDHVMDMLRLCRSDNMGMRRLAPALMLRLGRDQDAYDFIKWWATCDPDGTYDWGDMSLPHLDTKDADMLEEPQWWTGKVLDLSHASAVTLMKLRILMKLRDLQNTGRAFQASALPYEIISQVREEMLNDSPLAGRRDLAIADTATLTAMIKRVKKQIWTLYKAVEKANMHFWSLLESLEDDYESLQYPNSYSQGSEGEADLMMLYNYPAWEETPGAINKIRTLWVIQFEKKERQRRDSVLSV